MKILPFRSASLVRSSIIVALLLSINPAVRTYADETQPEFQMLCSVDHFGSDDPIVFPNKPGDSHEHSFYGNTTTNAASTATSLLAADSSCGRNMQNSDHSAYWIPSLYKVNADGSKTLVNEDSQQMFIYYRRAGGASGPKVQPFPVGFKMIAGNAEATSAQPSSVIVWDCGGGGPEYDYIPTCATDSAHTLHASLDFPNCWDGKNLDSADHASHMAYAAIDGTCPASHPVALPAIEYEIDYPGIPGGTSYQLASGGQFSMHGDFFAAWDSRVQNALVSSCLNTPNDCLDVNRDGNTLSYTPVAGSDTIKTINLNDFQASPQVFTAQATSLTTNSPAQTVAKTQPAALPNTGTPEVMGIFIITAIVGYLGYQYRLRRHINQ